MSQGLPDAQATRRVVITGAAGSIGRAVTERLSERWNVIATDIRAGNGLIGLDITDEHQCREAFSGADAVVHLAANPHETASWDELLPLNVVGLHTVAVASMAAAVPRLVLASSLQAVWGYPPDHQVRSGDAARPANLYGATKAWAEAVGSSIAVSSDTSVVALRIGYFSARPPTESDPRDLAAWLSPRDCAELVRAAVEGPVDQFTVVNGVSANRYRHATYGAAEKAIGYRPSSDAWAPSEED
jgi:uronate dehydrogenase